MQIELNRTFGGGVNALVSEDGWYVKVFERATSTGAAFACLESAKRLRALARKFEELANAEEPFSEKTQARINRKRT